MESNILIIVEGSKTEPNFFNRLSDVFGLKFEIYCLETNIYSLYKKMKEIDFNGDIKDVLSEIHPRMESYRDCDDYFENEYASAVISISKLSSYKNHVAKKKLCSKHIDKYTKEQFSLLILQNLYKLNLICCQKWNKPNYKEYSKYSASANILSEERKLATKDKVLSVINTSLFMITDYFGNRNGFYDSLNL